MIRTDKKITTILNCYNRAYTLEKQIEGIRNQSIESDIWIWYNKGQEEQPFIEEKYPDILTVRANDNFKFHGRFALALLAQTPYISVLDDDIVPGKLWYQNCLDTLKKVGNGEILGGSGVTLRHKAYTGSYKHGWNSSKPTEPQRVDLVGHAWFFSKETLRHMWREEPPTYDNGEDMMFSYLAQKYGGNNTWVPPHPEDNQDMWSNVHGREWASDKHATYLKGGHLPVRNNVAAWCINNGWDTVNKIK